MGTEPSLTSCVSLLGPTQIYNVFKRQCTRVDHLFSCAEPSYIEGCLENYLNAYLLQG